MRAIVLVAILAACGGHKKTVVGDGAPGGGGRVGAGDPDSDDDDDEGDGDDGGEPTGGKCPDGYQRSGSSCVPRKTGIGKGGKCDPSDPLGTSCGSGSQGWPDGNGATVVGAIPKDSIHKVVRDNFATIRQCYEQVLLGNPGIEGRVMVKMTVALDGAVTDASATGVHPDLETCVAEKIRKFRFPKPDNAGAVEITYPFVFKAG
jgi:TonB family protein